MTRVLSNLLLAGLLAALAAPPAEASFPGRNGLIAYSDASDTSKPAQIHTMTPAGEHRRKLTRLGPSRNPAWSRDGERLAFDRASDGGHRREVYVMKADGSHVRQVRTKGLQAFNPSWSPSGRKLVFEGCRGTTECEHTALWVVAVDGTRLKRIADDGSAPVWSPDGTWIAYYGKLDERDECSTLIRVKPSGRAPKAILPRNRDSHSVCSWGGSGADFSPNGERLVYYGMYAASARRYPNPGGGTFEVWTYDLAMYTVGKNGEDRTLVGRRSLENLEYFAPPFAWSPDGRRLLWRDDRGTYLGSPDGSGDRQISDAGSDFAWQSAPGG